MKLIKRKHAFTLAEVMIVLLVLTLLLAVFAPFITKRKTTKKDELWHWATRNYLAGPMDAFYNPEESPNASLFIGTTPDSKAEIESLYTPLGKIVIRSGYLDNDHLQHQIHLRHGRVNYEDIGHFAGDLLIDNANILFGAQYPYMKPKKTDRSYPANNIAIGFEALNEIGDRGENTDPALNNIAIGQRASEVLAYGDSNIAVGSGAGSTNRTGSRNIFIGYNAGGKTTANDNVLIGYNSHAGQGEHNVFVGANTGQQPNYVTSEGVDSNEYAKNTAIGYQALSSVTTGQFNVAIGSGALKNLQKGYYNVAIGYNACGNLINQWYKTCIGYNSGPASEESSPVGAELNMGIDDRAERTYIGSNPNLSSDGKTWTSNSQGYGGDAVLEIHNVGGNNHNLINEPDITSNTTTVINGNLVVMGKTYLTVGKVLYPFSYENNLFGAPYNEPCSNNQQNYSFATTGNCSSLSNLTGLSDRRLKDIISKSGAGLREINQLKIYNYNFKNDKDKKLHTGVLAQELQKIFPNSVTKDDDGYLKIRWEEMFYASINAIKEINTKLVSFIKQTTNMEAKLRQLEKENTNLQARVNALSKRVEALKNK